MVTGRVDGAIWRGFELSSDVTIASTLQWFTGQGRPQQISWRLVYVSSQVSEKTLDQFLLIVRRCAKKRIGGPRREGIVRGITCYNSHVTNLKRSDCSTVVSRLTYYCEA